jgi:beta-ribofuranosylaminobenzene 5'-phosphate synthase
MFRIRTPSRLHFGLLSLGGDPLSPWPDRQGAATLPARQFGSVGLMIEAPGVQITAEPASAWSAEGLLAARALVEAQRFAASWADTEVIPCHLCVDYAAPEHAGLGTGTQLALSVARLVAAVNGLLCPNINELSRHTGRGLRSGVGAHGFVQGGFLLDGGKGAAEGLAPLLVRRPFPDTWRVVLALPAIPPGLHGPEELQAFQELLVPAGNLARTDALCRLVLLGMLPALVEGDVQAFGEALHDFNARVGEAFAPVQDGLYAHAQVAEMVAWLRRQGMPGVGQSSWGPAVFAIVADEDGAQHLAARLRRQFGLADKQVLVTRACNRGAVLRDEAAP